MQALLNEKQSFSKPFEKLSPINFVTITIFTSAATKIPLRRKRRVDIDEFDLAFDLVLDEGVLVQVAGFEELEVIALDDQVAPAGFVFDAAFLDQHELGGLLVDSAPVETAFELERRAAAERGCLVQDRGLRAFTLVFDRGYPGVRQRFEIPGFEQAWKDFLRQLARRRSIVVGRGQNSCSRLHF